MKTKELKTNRWKAATEENDIIAQYDENIDTLYIYFTPEETERLVTHFVDNCVAFLYRRSDKEIVGMRIEYLDKLFIPEDTKVKEWRLQDANVELCGIEDISFAIHAFREESAPQHKQPISQSPREQIQLQPKFAPCPA
jgi:uncharacterized protein YuzE